MNIKILVSGILIAVLFSATYAPVANAAAVLSDLENALMCKCDDKCGKVLINCTCSTADKTRAEFSKMLESGLTVDQIIKMQVDKYGESVLSAPTKNGFNLTAWVMPFIALLVGGIGIGKVIEMWKNRGRQNEGEMDLEESSDVIARKYSSRLQKELDNIEI